MRTVVGMNLNDRISKLGVTLALVACLACATPTSLASTFYIDPINGSAANSGSESAPWRTLQEVLDSGLIESRSWRRPYSPGNGLEPKNTGAPVKAGDTLILMSGYHGKIDVHRYVNTQTIFIRAGTNQTPTISQLHFQASARWAVSGLKISPAYGDSDQSTLVRIESHGYNGPSSDITINDNDVFSAQDISGWSAGDWLNRAKSGISVDGDGSVIQNNSVRNIAFGITVSSNNVTVSSNRVINFSGDAIRGLGDYGLFEYNFVANAFDVNDNHDDGFQSWSRNGKPVVGVTLRGNQFYTNYNHPNPSLLSTFQGIGCFDGYYNNWRIENNLLALSHWHGISVYGANNTTIINNTVVDDLRHTDDRMVPWIKLTQHKDGSYGHNNVVRNNIARLSSINSGVAIDHNFDPDVEPDDHSNYDLYFVDRHNFNFKLRASAPAVDGGSSLLAPDIDILGRKRSGPIDAGAFQFGSVHLPILDLLL